MNLILTRIITFTINYYDPIDSITLRSFATS